MGPQLHALRDHSFIVGTLRARRSVCLPLSPFNPNMYGETLGCCYDLAGQRSARAATAKWRK
jgi:hypothetical protein